METTNTKGQKLTETQEDYLEAILELLETKREVRNMDLADNFGVKRATVTRALQLLTRKGLIVHRMNGNITLTEAGREIAADIRERHVLFSHFFRDILSLNEAEASDTACKIEHSISGTALHNFREFIKKVDDCGCFLAVSAGKDETGTVEKTGNSCKC